jgi:hypothetical protein
MFRYSPISILIRCPLSIRQIGRNGEETGTLFKRRRRV